MATTIDSVIQHPIATPRRHRAVFALAAGIVAAGVLATTAVLVDDNDGASSAPKQHVVSFRDSPAQDRQLRLTGHL